MPRVVPEKKRHGRSSGDATPKAVATPARGGRGGTSGAIQARKDVEPEIAPLRSTGHGSNLEDILLRKGIDEALDALDEMQQQGLTSDKFTVSRILMKTVGDGRVKLAPNRVYRGIALVERFIATQPQDVDEVMLNALLDTCCRLKDLNRLEATVKKMRELQVQASPVTLGILVKAYGQAGDLQKVLGVWEEMVQQRNQANAVTYGCMIDACVKCGDLDKAVDIFQSMRPSGKHRNTILYTTLIKGYGLEKHLDKALELFREMPQEGVPYNTITYNSIIDACVKCGHLLIAEEILREITSSDSTSEPDLITFSTLLKGYCHIGDLDKALRVAEIIKARGLRCDELVYNTLVDGCVKANDVCAGVGLFEEMVAYGLRPSAITHSILVQLYQKAGYEDDANEAVSKLYQLHGIERVGGGDRGRARRGRGVAMRPRQHQQHRVDEGWWNEAPSPMAGSHLAAGSSTSQQVVWLPNEAMQQGCQMGYSTCELPNYIPVSQYCGSPVAAGAFSPMASHMPWDMSLGQSSPMGVCVGMPAMFAPMQDAAQWQSAQTQVWACDPSTAPAGEAPQN